MAITLSEGATTMKTYSIFMIALTVSLAFLLILAGCEGPAGPAGKDGKDATLPPFSLEGFAPGIECTDCHSADRDTTYYVAGRKYQWEQSVHATGGTSERNSTSCAGCHTTEGFVERMNGQAVTNQYNPSPIGCFACHSPHARANFSLRDKTPVTIGSNIAGVPDAVFNYGNGNLCVKCHQTRSMTPKATATGDSIVIATSRWYSHYGVQGQMLMGEGGFKFPGYAYTGNSRHTDNQAITQEGCPICHMAEQAYPPGLGTGKAGGHTMNIAFEGEGGAESFLLTGCNQTGCHTSPAMSAATLQATQDSIQHGLDSLYTLLLAQGWIDTTGTEPLVKLTGNRLVIRPAVKAGALYNWFFVKHDLSLGIHNTKYANELLQSSIEALQSN